MFYQYFFTKFKWNKHDVDELELDFAFDLFTLDSKTDDKNTINITNYIDDIF